MPVKPRKPCAHPGCPALVDPVEKYCPAHKPLHPVEVRPAAARGYDRRWQKVSRKFLEAHPFCENCLAHGKYEKATVVDHIQPHRGDPEKFWDEKNWQSLCKPCHDKKTGKNETRVKYNY